MSLTPEQQEMRKTGIGASEAAAAIGVDPYKTPLKLWMEKTGRAEPEPESQPAYWGTRLEAIVIEEYATRMEVECVVPNETLRSDKHSYQLATPDGYAWNRGDDSNWLVQAKTSGMWMFQKWGKDRSVIEKAHEAAEVIPEEKVVQVHQEMAVTGLLRADIPVLIGGQDFRIFHVYRDDAFCDLVTRLVGKFWHGHVVADIAPDVSNVNDIKLLFPEDDGSVVTATDEIALAHAELQATKASIKEQDDAKQKLEFDIKRFMGPAGQLLIDPDGQVLATWKSHDRGGKPVRTFRLKEAA